MLRVRFLLFTLSLALFFFPRMSTAQISYVPGNYPTIAEAVIHVSDGTTILVDDGVYGFIDAENLSKNLYIKSAKGPSNCIIDGGGTSLLLRIENDPSYANTNKNIVFDGFTFRNGRGKSGINSPITIAEASPVFLNSIFENNSSLDKGGAVLVYGNAAHASFIDCIFRNNSSNNWGGAALISGGHAQATFKRCTFENNTTRTPNTHNLMSQGGAIKFSQGGGRIIDSEFRNNSAAYAGGAIQILNSFEDSSRAVVEISGCIFNGNYSRSLPGVLPENPPPSEAGAIMVEDNVSVSIKGTLFTNNVSNSGAGVMVYRGILHIEDSIFDGNTADGANLMGFGGAIGINSNDAGPPLRPNAEVSLRNVMIRNNVAPVGGGILAQGNVHWGTDVKNNGRLILDNVALVNNTATQANNSYGNGGGLFLNMMDVTATDLYLINNTAEYVGGGWAMVQNTHFTLTDSYVVGNKALVQDSEYHGPGNPDPTFVNTVRAYNDGGGSTELTKLVAIPPKSFDRQAYLTYLNLPYGNPTLQPGSGLLPDNGGYGAGSVVSEMLVTTTYTLATQQENITTQVPRAYRSRSSRAYGAEVPVMPGLLEAEQFDLGGHMQAYFDRTPENFGGASRLDERVDVGEAQNASGGYAVGWIENGEWLDYTFYTPGGTYQPKARVASPASEGLFYISINGNPVSGIISVPSTDGWTSWRELDLPAIILDEGFHVLRFVCVQGGFNLDRFSLDGESPWKTEVGVVNNDASTLTGVLRGFSSSGQEVWTQNVSLAGHGRVELDVTSAAGNVAEQIKSMRLDITSGRAVGYQKFYQAGKFRVGLEASSNANQASLFVPHIHSDDDWWTGIGWKNTTNTGKNIIFSFDNYTQATRSIGAGEHQAFTVASLFQGNKQPDIGAARIDQGAGMIGVMLFGGDKVLSGVSLSDTTATTLYFPHVAENHEWWTGLVVYNPGTQTADLTLSYHDAQGGVIGTGTAQVQQGQKMVGTPANLGFPEGTEWLSVHASLPVSGFELFGTTNENQLGGYSVVNLPTTTGIFPKIEQNGWTGIAFVNILDTATSIQLSARNDAGNILASADITLNPGQKKVELPQNLFQEDISSASYISFSADGPVAGFQLNGSNDGTMLDALPALHPGMHAGTSALHFPHIHAQ